MEGQKNEEPQAGNRACRRWDNRLRVTPGPAVLPLLGLLGLLAGAGALGMLTVRGWSGSSVSAAAPAPSATPAYSRFGYERILDRHHRAGLQALDFKLDTARGRLWILGWQAIYLYDMTSARLLREMPLPPGLLQRGGCTPNFTLDREGRAIVASNAAPLLLRIDATRTSGDTLRVTPLNRDTADSEGSAQTSRSTPQPSPDVSLKLSLGLATVTYAPDGDLYGLSPHDGALWRFDGDLRHAARIALAGGLNGLCSLRVIGSRNVLADPPYQLCAANDQASVRIGLAPDRTQTHVMDEPCAY